ncbi:MAG: enoyl-CoA hydratase/isomerase family protein [Actinobacteria bacterium]|nr:enoyl-CoA hydratase/isomerase family protein [Actinomycetota bacterium]
MATYLNVDVRGAVVSVEIARPPGNLFTLEMCRQLTGVLRSPPPGTRALLLTAAGPAFCLGRERGARLPAEVHAMTSALAELNAAVVSSSLAVVAQVSGDAAGYGVGLAALADVTLAAETARFWFPEAEAGLSPALVLTWLPALLGRRLAFWLTATGLPLSAAEAERAGLINRAVPPDALPAAAADAVGVLLRQPAEVCGEIKRDLAAFSAPGLGEAADRAVDRLTLRSLLMDGRARP